MKTSLLRLGNKLYERCYPVYFPLYATYKALSDRAERQLFREFVRPGMTVVDVGGNIGIYTRCFAGLAGPSGRVHSFEPGPANYAHLKENTRRLANVVINHAAVGERNGVIKLFMSDELNVDHRTFDSGDGRRSVEVPVVSLDDYFKPGQKVDFIKIDVQGYEWNVLQGARRVLAENADLKILVEYWPWGLRKAAAKPSDLLRLFKSLGFRINKVSDGASEPFDGGTDLDPDNPNHYCNLLVHK
jgi:FkbM family methyltransferase